MVFADSLPRSREWELTPFGKVCQTRVHHGLPFSLMSYNVLAQDLLLDNQYLYRDHPTQVLDWEHRKQKLVQEFSAHQPDVSESKSAHGHQSPRCQSDNINQMRPFPIKKLFWYGFQFLCFLSTRIWGAEGQDLCNILQKYSMWSKNYI